MKKFIYILFCLLIAVIGCSSSETIIKDRKIEIKVPEIRDTIRAKFSEIPKEDIDNIERIFEKLPDSAIKGEKEIMTKKGKVKTKVTYYPKRKFFELDIAEYAVDTTITDTTKIVEKKETTTAEKLGYGAIGVIVFIVLIVLAVLIALAIKYNLIKI